MIRENLTREPRPLRAICIYASPPRLVRTGFLRPWLVRVSKCVILALVASSHNRRSRADRLREWMEAPARSQSLHECEAFSSFPFLQRVRWIAFRD